jgi:hypothetical protein
LNSSPEKYKETLSIEQFSAAELKVSKLKLASSEVDQPNLLFTASRLEKKLYYEAALDG